MISSMPAWFFSTTASPVRATTPSGSTSCAAAASSSWVTPSAALSEIDGVDVLAAEELRPACSRASKQRERRAVEPAGAELDEPGQLGLDRRRLAGGDQRDRVADVVARLLRRRRRRARPRRARRAARPRSSVDDLLAGDRPGLGGVEGQPRRAVAADDLAVGADDEDRLQLRSTGRRLPPRAAPRGRRRPTAGMTRGVLLRSRSRWRPRRRSRRRRWSPR